MHAQNQVRRINRRAFIAGSGLLAGGVAAATIVPQAAFAAPGRPGSTSANGWPVRHHAADVPAHPVEGSNVSVALLGGPVADVLRYVVRRYHYEIATLQTGDVLGYRAGRKVTTPYESNYLSGTALTVREHLYPAGVAGGFFPAEVAILRDILAECQGVVRWGGDDRSTPKESHFQIDVAPGHPTLATVAARVSGRSDVPGAAAGVPADPFAPSRRSAALRLAERQKATA